MADMPDFDYILIDNMIARVDADATRAKAGLRLPRSGVAAAT